MAQGQLMFEVGIQSAEARLKEIEKEFKESAQRMGGYLQIKVNVDELGVFTKALQELGSGKQLKPLLERIETLQASLAKLGVIPQNVDMSAVEKQLKAIDKTQKAIAETQERMKSKPILERDAALALPTKTLENQRRALEENFGMTEKIARVALESYKKMQDAASNSNIKIGTVNVEGFDKLEGKAIETKEKVDALGQSVEGLHKKLGDGITLNADFSKFETWATEVNNLVGSVRNLVEQMEKLNAVSGQQGGANDTALKARAEAIEKMVAEQEKLVQLQDKWEKANSLYNGSAFFNTTLFN